MFSYSIPIACLYYVAVVLLLLSPAVVHSHIVYDPRYGTPTCELTDVSLLNQYATLTLSSDMLRENLTIDIETHSLNPYSCYLCATHVQSDYYCNSSVPQSDVTLALDLSFNMLILATAQDTPFPYALPAYDNHFMFDTMHESLAVSRLTLEPVSCDIPLNLIIMPLFTLFYPHQLDFIAMVRDENDAHRLVCNATTRIFATVDCSVIGQQYTYVTLDTPNCVADRLTSVPLAVDLATIARYSPLYWYRESLSGVYRANGATASVNTMRLCGAPMIDTLLGSNMTLLCGPDNHYYAQFWSWYLLAHQVIAARLNLYAVPGRTPQEQATLKRTVGMPLLAAQIMLEAACDQRQAFALSQPAVYSLYIKLVQFNNNDVAPPQSIASLCADVARLLNLSLVQIQAPFLPRYLAYYDQWFFQYFQYLLYWGASDSADGQSMRVGSIILLTLGAMACLSCLVFLFILPTWICCTHWCREYKRRKRKKNKPQHGYELIR